MSNDHWEISNLIARYAELLNLGRIEEVGALLRHARVTAESNPTAYEGEEEIVAMYRDSVVFGDNLPDTLIFTTNLQIHVDGDTATSKAYFLVMHDGGSGLHSVLGGRYHDEFRRIENEWCFTKRHMFTDLLGDLSTHLTRPLEDYLQESSEG